MIYHDFDFIYGFAFDDEKLIEIYKSRGYEVIGTVQDPNYNTLYKIVISNGNEDKKNRMMPTIRSCIWRHTSFSYGTALFNHPLCGWIVNLISFNSYNRYVHSSDSYLGNGSCAMFSPLSLGLESTSFTPNIPSNLRRIRAVQSGWWPCETHPRWWCENVVRRGTRIKVAGQCPPAFFIFLVSL